jgi:putative hemolysin
VVGLYVGVVLLLILVEAVFVATEISLVSLREGQVKALSEAGHRAQRVARLVHDPNRFLAAVQIGVTTTALLSSAFGAVTLSESAKRQLIRLGMGDGLAAAIGVIGVTLAITYVTLVIGELAPKRLALQRAERTAMVFGPPLDRLAIGARPVIWLLSKSTDVIVRLLGGDPDVQRETISEEELRDLVAAHESLSRDERRLIGEVFEAGDRAVREVMVPRTEVEFLEAGMPTAKAQRIARNTPHSRFPVFRSSHDEIVGFVHVRDLFAEGARASRVGDLVREVALLPSSRRVLDALSDLRRAGHHIAVVVDEYGGTAGIVTLEDLIEELIGEIRDEYDVGESPSRQIGADIEVDGLLNLDDFAEATGLELPDGPFETVAGFVLAELGRLPRLGDSIEVDGRRLTVTGLDGRRIARLRVTRLPETTAGPAGPAGSARERAEAADVAERPVSSA